MEPRDREWSFNGVAVCDAVDPEGNVIQFREIGQVTQRGADGLEHGHGLLSNPHFSWP